MTPIQLDFKPSTLLIVSMLGFTVMISLIVMVVDLAWHWQLLIIVTIVSSTAYAIHMHGTRSLPRSVVKLTVNAKQELHIVRKDGQRLLAQIEASSVVTPYLTILQLRPSQAQGHEKAWRNRQAIIVLPDNVEKEAYRQLRIWLRWGNHKSDQPNLP
jgi:toxin CptA